MSGRQFRKLLLFVAAIGVGYWFYKDRPSFSGFIDSITDPLMSSRAAVKSSERNRVVGEAIRRPLPSRPSWPSEACAKE